MKNFKFLVLATIVVFMIGSCLSCHFEVPSPGWPLCVNTDRCEPGYFCFMAAETCGCVKNGFPFASFLEDTSSSLAPPERQAFREQTNFISQLVARNMCCFGEVGKSCGPCTPYPEGNLKSGLCCMEFTESLKEVFNLNDPRKSKIIKK